MDKYYETIPTLFTTFYKVIDDSLKKQISSFLEELNYYNIALNKFKLKYRVKYFYFIPNSDILAYVVFKKVTTLTNLNWRAIDSKKTKWVPRIINGNKDLIKEWNYLKDLVKVRFVDRLRNIIYKDSKYVNIGLVDTSETYFLLFHEEIDTSKLPSGLQQISINEYYNLLNEKRV